MIIAAPRLFVNGAFTGPGAVVLEAGIIQSILAEPPARADVSLTSGFLSPGLIDIHNNGAFGVDCATATPAEWDIYIAALASRGVTSVLPTIITAPLAAIHEAAARIAAAMQTHPAILGLHLEGPFLAPGKRGAHREDWLQLPTEAALAELLADAALRGIMRLLTLAPELPGAEGAIRTLTALGIKTALGHSNATATETARAADAGATIVTHVFNAQPPLHHRAPGLPGAALTDPRLSPCLITDGVHVDPILLRLAFAACPRAIAVTDSILLAGEPDGTSGDFGGAPARLEKGAPRREDGTLAGAAITLDEGIRRLIAAGVPPETALAAATSRPAAALGLTDRGRLAPGQRADLIWWNDDFMLQQVWTAGRTKLSGPRPAGTETARPDLDDLETRDTIAIVKLFLAQEQAAQTALVRTAASIAALADAIAAKLAAGGRLFTAGAGTSGRLALLDAVECGPTFGIPDGLLVPLLAGGPTAFLRAIEGAEDDPHAAAKTLKEANFSAADALIGIAASGTTPFTLGAVTYANGVGALTGAIVNNPDSPIAAAATIAIKIDSGPEIIAGSTRLAAGTTQKVALNILSSTIMIRLGKTYGPYMVDLRATNEKLRRRALRITRAVSGVSEDAARNALTETAWHVKTAILLLRHNCPAADAREKLRAANGSLRKALMTTP
jgi:N-acetylglucosamine-6-phosphate deacetylase